MIGSEIFWETETGAPLLRRNFGCVTKENAETLLLRARKFVDYVDEYVSQNAATNERFDVLLPSPIPRKTGADGDAAAAPAAVAPQTPRSEQQGEKTAAATPPEEKKGPLEEHPTEVAATGAEKELLSQAPGEENRRQQRRETPGVPAPSASSSPSSAPAVAAAVLRTPAPAAVPPSSSADIPTSSSAGVPHSSSSAGIPTSSADVPTSSSSAGIPSSSSSSSTAGASPPVSSSGKRSAAAAAPAVPPPSFQRIFALDAERTFRDAGHRQQMETVLAKLHEEVMDYHQGMGFLVAFLLLFLPPDDVEHVVLQLHRHYVPGYFAAAPAAYVRDARVYQKLLQRLYPAVANHLEQFTCPEAYVSKWFIGMTVHVLPFPALVLFFENFLQQGERFLFKFALALVHNVQNLLLRVRDVSTLLAILRLDAALFPDAAPAATAVSEAAAAAAASHKTAATTSAAVAAIAAEKRGFAGDKGAAQAAASAGGDVGRAAHPAAADAAGQARSATTASEGAGGGKGEGELTRDKADEEEEKALIPGSFFVKIVEDAAALDLSDYDIDALRQEALEEMRLEEEKRKEREKQLGLDDDDEIVFSDEEEEETKENQKRENE